MVAEEFLLFQGEQASSNSGSSPGKWVLGIVFLVQLQREIKRCAFSNFTCSPRIAIVPAYNSRHRCESDTVAGKLLRGVKPLKPAIGGTRIRSDSVIASSRNKIDRNSVFKGLDPEFNSCTGTAGRIFPGIAKQIVDGHSQKTRIALYRGRSAITNSTVRSGTLPRDSSQLSVHLGQSTRSLSIVPLVRQERFSITLLFRGMPVSSVS